ncbi:MAG TPA: hypothetical protein PLF61_01710, partial [Candidatus Goldiibacteriota bacterium]|nr:hypothetical protein [Candidatus Goldiibacteriota bacterium]
MLETLGLKPSDLNPFNNFINNPFIKFLSSIFLIGFIAFFFAFCVIEFFTRPSIEFFIDAWLILYILIYSFLKSKEDEFKIENPFILLF